MATAGEPLTTLLKCHGCVMKHVRDMSDHWHLAQQASGPGSMQGDDSCVCCTCAEAPAAAGGAQLIDGKMTSELIRKEIALEAAAVKSKYGKASLPTHSGH